MSEEAPKWFNYKPSRIDKISIPDVPGLKVFIKRDDLIHPIVSGNKWRKLKYNLSSPLFEGLISFGGAFSNHLHALAYACHMRSLPLKAIVRGKPEYLDNPTLQDIHGWGAEIVFVDRNSYRKRYDQDYLASLNKKYPKHKIVPEGGSNESGIRGVEELGLEIAEQFPGLEHLVLPVGSGGTIAGLIRSMPREVKIIGVSVGKENYLEKMISKWLPEERPGNWKLDRRFHFGGFGHCPSNLRAFMQSMYPALPLDVVYNAKGFYAFLQFVRMGTIDPAKSLYLHTGGLQGNRAYKYLYPGTLDWISD